MNPPLTASDSGASLHSDDDWVDARKILDSLRFRVERLLHEEECSTPRTGGKAARESDERSTRIGAELFDDLTGRMIFG